MCGFSGSRKHMQAKYTVLWWYATSETSQGSESINFQCRISQGDDLHTIFKLAQHRIVCPKTTVNGSKRNDTRTSRFAAHNRPNAKATATSWSQKARTKKHWRILRHRFVLAAIQTCRKTCEVCTFTAVFCVLRRFIITLHRTLQGTLFKISTLVLLCDTILDFWCRIGINIKFGVLSIQHSIFDAPSLSKLGARIIIFGWPLSTHAA